VSDGSGDVSLPMTVRGLVVPGDRRGRELGFPTANVRPDPEHPLPAFGIYAGWVEGHQAAISVGVRPTFGVGLEPLVEAHLLDFDGDLYGSEIRIEFVRWLRPELRFDSADALRRQIAEDVRGVRSALTRGSPED
jgi:riboflavin kinase / FMN adenylyltransferase